jgi:type II secretory pathway pseudopilin PulG
MIRTLATQNNTTQISHSAFTLIELMIAVGLGMLIVLVAMSGMRTASQSLSIANRLSLENSLMRAGYFTAMSEADWWISYDNPDDPNQQKLRQMLDPNQARDDMRALPFMPFNPRLFPTVVDPNPDRQRGWRNDFYWPANDSRTWFSGNLIEQNSKTEHLFGHYELFSHYKIAPRLDRPMVTTWPNATTGPLGVPFNGRGAPRYTWYANQLQSLRNSLGYYGVVDYMPANAIYGIHGDPGADNKYDNNSGAYVANIGRRDIRDQDQRMEIEWSDPNGSTYGRGDFVNGDGGTSWARGIYRITRDSTFAIIPASEYTSAQTAGWNKANLISEHIRLWSTDRVSQSVAANSGNGIQDLRSKALIDQPLIPMKPESWPDMRVECMRYLSNSRFVALFRIGWNSALTGELQQISFTTVSTSLRGARQQRLKTGGWVMSPGDRGLD